MVYAAGDLHIDTNVSFDGFFGFHILLDIHAEVNDAKTNLHMSVSNNGSSVNHGSGAGTGFINVAAAIWDPVSFDSRYDLGNNYWNEDWTTIRDGQVYPGSNYQLRDKVVYGVYESDDAAHRVSGVLPLRSSYDIALSSSDFDANGDLRDRIVVGYGCRRFQNYIPFPNTSQVVLLNTFTVSLSQIMVSYFPLSRRLNGRYMSCNRGGGYVQTMTGGQWQDRKNSNMESRNTVFIRNGGWKALSKTGSES